MRSYKNTMVVVVLLVSGLVGLPPQGAHAKNLSKMLYDSGIEPESLEIMQNAARALYTANPKSTGDTKAWTNSKTGTAGTVEIVGLKDNCTQIRHSVTVARSGKGTDVRVWWCQQANGDWQLTASP